MARKVIQIEERPPFWQLLPLSLQHLLAMFGATVLVPFLFHVNPATSLLFNGIGTLIYLYICRGKIPAYLGSSFAFIAPVLLILATPQMGGYAAAQGGFIVVGIFYIMIALIISRVGAAWIDIVLPPAAMGSIVAVIGLELASAATDMAGFTGTTIKTASIPTNVAISVALGTLIVTILSAALLKGFLGVVPVLMGVLAGYGLATFFKITHINLLLDAPWFALPTFYRPSFDLHAILILFPAALVTLSEHVGHLIVTSIITNHDLIKNPGLHRSLLGDGISNVLSGIFGATPNTTYGENIGVMTITKVYSVWVIGGAAIFAIIISFIGKVAVFIRDIPLPVMGGVCIFLFGVIAASGVRIFIDRKVDLSQPKNLILTAVILTVGVSGAQLTIGAVQFKGMVLATFVAIFLNLLFLIFDKLGWQSETTFEQPKIPN